MKKHLANIITSLRIMGSVVLLLFDVSSFPFYITYLLCGFSDMIDGAIARRMGEVSKLGARLDTASDLIFMLACSLKILPIMNIPIWLWVWIIIVALIKIFNITLIFIRKKRLISIHSVLNKITGFTLFILPLSLTLIKTAYSVATICVLATIAAMQEVCFVVKGQDVL